MNYFFAIFFLFLFFTFRTVAETGRTVNLYIENDSRNLGGPGSDNAYSNGFKFSYISADNKIPLWAKPFISNSEFLNSHLKTSESNFSLAVGHQIYTPNNLTIPTLITTDRPYAAWFYIGFDAHFKNEHRSHVVELDVGFIGPEAAGETIQNGYHRAFAVDLAQGWKNQLGSEATLQLSYQQRLKYFTLQNKDGHNYFDIIPLFGGGFGNVSINAYVGGIVRIGNFLPEDFGPTRTSSPEGDAFVEPDRKRFTDSSFYGFAGLRGTGVLRNIFLDGNTFRDSPRVHKNNWVGETEFGVGGILYNWSATWSYVTRSAEFKEQNVSNSFAALSATYSF